MSADWPDLAGRLAPDGGHRMAVRIYFEDTDFSGVVYHASYLRFFERARSDWLRLLGVSHADLAPIGAFAVRSLSIEYLRPARIDDVLTIETRRTAISGASVHLHQTASRDGERLVEADVRAVLVSREGRPMRLPADLRRRFGEREG